jgi:hypothetical protein
VASRSGGGFSTATVREIEMDCRPALCAEGGACLEDGRCIDESSDCSEDCSGDDVCFEGRCQAALPSPYVEDMPPATGMYNDLAVTADGLALVFYERAAGNLHGARFEASAWTEPFLIDGWAASDPNVGDSGIGASLFVDDAGVWHVTYVDGVEEALRYARVEGDAVTTTMVDDGETDGTAPNPDGRHIVGDDSSVVVTGGGEIRIVYQDATVQRTMLARTSGVDAAFAIEVLDAEDHTGFWLDQLLDGSRSRVVSFFRNIAEETSGVRILDVE